MTGILVISNRESRINGTLLAREDGDDPFVAATDFLEDSGCRDGDCVTVTGTQGNNAFFIDSATREPSSVCEERSASAMKAAAPARAKRQKKTTKATKKKPAGKRARKSKSAPAKTRRKKNTTNSKKRGRR